jgi:hypothetical protein
MEQFYDFPCVFIGDWDEVTEEFLHEQYEKIINRDYDLSKLYVSYWNKEIVVSV